MHDVYWRDDVGWIRAWVLHGLLVWEVAGHRGGGDIRASAQHGRNGPSVSAPLCEELFCIAETYLLSEGPESYHYLSQSGCVQDNSLDDKQLFDSVMVS